MGFVSLGGSGVLLVRGFRGRCCSQALRVEGANSMDVWDVLQLTMPTVDDFSQGAQQGSALKTLRTLNPEA